jgi:hypothetical protein
MLGVRRLLASWRDIGNADSVVVIVRDVGVHNVGDAIPDPVGVILPSLSPVGG